MSERRPAVRHGTESPIRAPSAAGDAMPELDPARLRRFVEGLAAHPTARIDRDALWRIFSAAFPHRPAGPDERRWLNTAIAHAASAGVVRWPATSGPRWDRAVRPAVPTSLDRVGPAATPRDDTWRREPWHPSLAWVPELPRCADDVLAFLRRVQAGLVAGHFQTPAPLKYRSLELTGDEKRLGVLARSTLFAPGRLSLELLGCLPELLPIAWTAVSDAPTVLVFENAGPFLVALRTLREMPAPPYGMVAYGGGGQVRQSIGWLATIGRPVNDIHYVGDLDRPGLGFLVGADTAARAAGLPRVSAAPGVHAAMLASATALGSADGWPYDERTGEHAADDALVQVLPAALRTQVRRILEAGRRIPEEVLGPRELRRALESPPEHDTA